MTTRDETPGDLRWRRLLRAELTGEALAPDDAAFLAQHRGDDVVTRRERELLDELRGDPAAEAADDEGRDEVAIAAAVGRAFAGPTSAATPTPRAVPLPRARWRRVALAVGALAAAAAVVVAITAPRDLPRGEIAAAPSPRATPDPRTAPPREPPAEYVPEVSPTVRRLAGQVVGPDAELRGDAALPEGLVALGGGACVGAPGRARVCAEGPAQASMDGALLTLEEGRFTVEVEATEAGHVWLVVAGVAIVSEGAGTFALDVRSARWEVRATRGALRLCDADGEEVRVAEGASAVRPEAAAAEPVDPAPAPTAAGASSRPRPPSDPGQLLGEAHALRGAGEHRAAAAVYRRLIREHKGTSLARTAEVSLGQLYLGPLADPRAALASFDAYLRAAPAGVLVEDALFGRAQALQRLGRGDELARARADFLRRFPRSRHAAALQTPL